MRTLCGLALASTLMLVDATEALAQGRYSGGYAFKDEPEMSINRSYLGYTNFVYYGPHPPTHANPPGPGAAWSPGYVRPPAPTFVPARRGFRWFGWRLGYPY